MNEVNTAADAPVEQTALTPEATEMLKQVGVHVDEILGLVAGKPLGVAVAACVEAAVFLITHPTTQPGMRASFAQIFMAQAHDVSAIVSQEQSDLPQAPATEGAPLIQLVN
jgi:hypothetical protein